MDAPLYIEILRETLIPFLHKAYPEGHRFMQDNDPKHTSKAAKSFIAENRINWWQTPAESPDLNPIENLWHELKEYVRREVKPTSKDELVCGILKFRDTVTPEMCRKYIRHLQKVIPRVIELNGAATGYWLLLLSHAVLSNLWTMLTNNVLDVIVAFIVEFLCTVSEGYTGYNAQ